MVERESAVLSRQFAENPEQERQWTAFLKRIGLKEETASFAEVAKDLRTFLLPVWDCVREQSTLSRTWNPKGPWK
jgi:hypothetical protein